METQGGNLTGRINERNITRGFGSANYASDLKGARAGVDLVKADLRIAI